MQPWVQCAASQCPSLQDPLEGPPWAAAALAALLLLHLQLAAYWEALTALPWHLLVREGFWEGRGVGVWLGPVELGLYEVPEV
jgi:hypothetical protein